MKILYDSKCPICIKNKLLVEKHDKENILLFVDIHNNSDDLEKCMEQFPEINFSELNSKIYVINENEPVGGMDAIRMIYYKIGFCKLVNFSKLPIIDKIFNLIYKFVSKNRFKISKFFKIKYSE